MGMDIVLNGRKKSIEDGLSIRRLLEQLSIPSQTVIVEINRKIIERADFEETIIHPDDRIEIIRLVGGG